jgi:methionine sulfoxide reductase heme-binding subunit
MLRDRLARPKASSWRRSERIESTNIRRLARTSMAGLERLGPATSGTAEQVMAMPTTVLSRFTTPDWIRRAIYFGGALPAVWFFYAGFTDRLGADPVRTLERDLGLYALRFLVIGLAITPLRRLGGPNLVRYRRAIGLLAFFYAALHFLAYLWFDQNFAFADIWRDIVKRPYITIGFAALLILVPLAVTSNNASIKRLGAQTWQRLHKWVYAACVLAALHFLLLLKVWPPEPLIYAGLVAVFLLFRLGLYVQKIAKKGRASRVADAA